MFARAFERFSLFLGPARLRALFILIAATGLTSLILNVIVDDFAWVAPVQTVLALGTVIGALIIIGGRMDPVDRRRWIVILIPAFGAVLLALFAPQEFRIALLGGALGWLIAASLLMRGRTPTGYKTAVRALRKGDLETAVKSMDEVIREEPEDSNHYRFRAELLRLWGKLDRARRDYARMAELLPDSAVAYNGLAEVDLQSGNFERAHASALKAVELAPGEWVALYNLGMIEDRMGRSEAVVDSLMKAAAMKIPDARHRVLICLYLARAHARLGEADKAAAAVMEIKKQRAGLAEWQKILQSEQAEVLRNMLGEDIALAQQLVDGDATVETLGTA
ncbi:MAG: tetratricopeptide repeat protein [Pleurocapsa minor GSE-CHR-MK-17-07R]|jgi:tetratricopeptide (TPR) repeat protein|nr:tetratricopeptide repeat protein [Pleurocapsa minor GSE-CHR-MK 17-07R]